MQKKHTKRMKRNYNFVDNVRNTWLILHRLHGFPRTEMKKLININDKRTISFFNVQDHMPHNSKIFFTTISS